MESIAINADSEAGQAAMLFAAIEAMEATIAVADALATGLRRIDLAGLEDEVGRICAASLATPRSVAPAVRARLEGLLRRIDQLKASLPTP